MSDDPIREYLAVLGKELGRFARHRRRTLAEVEDHLREAAARIEHNGVSRDEAARQAVEQFGSPRVVGDRLTGPRVRRGSWVGVRLAVAAAVSTAVVGLAVVGFRDTHRTTSRTPSLVTQRQHQLPSALVSLLSVTDRHVYCGPRGAGTRAPIGCRQP
jgi:hypothetical protein